MRKPAEITALMVKALIDGPKSAGQLYKAMGLDSNKHATMRRNLEAFRGVGLIRVCRWETASVRVYEWQPVPNALDDAPRPQKSASTVRQAMQGVRAPTLPDSAAVQVAMTLGAA